jgi:hypothetical protein
MAAAIRNAYMRMGFTGPTATHIRDVESLDDIDELTTYSTHDIENLCKGLRRTPVNAAAPPYHVVSMRAEKHMKLTTFLARYYAKVSRTMTWQTITIANLNRMQQVKEHETAYHEPTEVPKFDPKKPMARFIETLDAHFRGLRGETKIPLSYVIRNDEAIMPEGDDPDTNYTSPEDEMTARAPLFGNDYVNDNKKVFDVLRTILVDTDPFVWIKDHQRRRNGRGAWMSLKAHYLGASRADTVANTAENQMDNTFYEGERRRFGFEKYVQVHREAHAEIAALAEEGLHDGIDNRTKVRKLTNGIRTKALDAPKATILATDALRADFDRAVDILSTFVSLSNQTRERESNVSSTGTDSHGGRGRGGRSGRGGGRSYNRDDRRSNYQGRGGGNSRGGGRGRGRGGGGRGRGRGRGRGTRDRVNGLEISDRYYSQQEFQDLGPEGRSQVIAMRDGRNASSTHIDYDRLAAAVDRRDNNDDTGDNNSNNNNNNDSASNDNNNNNNGNSSNNSNSNSNNNNNGNRNRDNPALNRRGGRR